MDGGSTEGGVARGERNLWDQVQDFNWLRAEPSPHWSVLPVEEREGVDWARLRGDAGDGGAVKEMVDRLSERKAGGMG